MVHSTLKIIKLCNKYLEKNKENPTHHYTALTDLIHRMKHDPFPILIHLGEREDYSGVSRGREIVLCCCVRSSRRASYILIHRTSAQRISPKR